MRYCQDLIRYDESDSFWAFGPGFEIYKAHRQFRIPWPLALVTSNAVIELHLDMHQALGVKPW